MALVSVAAVAAGLLGGFFGGKVPTHSPWFYLGLTGFGVLIVCVCVILAPHKTIFENDPRVIIENYVDAGLDLNATLRWTAFYNGANSESNRRRIDLLVSFYLAAVIALGVVVGGFAVALVTGGKHG